MKENVEFSELARDDLEEIWLYIAFDNEDAADKLMNELEAKFDLLARGPYIGTSISEFVPSLRQFPHDRYNIFYFALANGVEIHRVLHSARDTVQIFEDEQDRPN